jgi:pimeloyl-ACP methyl ester carboxylesterase
VVAELPSTGPDPAALGGLLDDAAQVRRLLDGIDEHAVVAGYSYGGMVLTEVADHPRIARSVYVTAFWPPPGMSLTDLVGGELPHWIVVDPSGTAVGETDDLETAHRILCADLDRERFRPWHSRRSWSSMAAFGTPGSGPARSHPTSYVICTRDAAIPPEAQEQMAAQSDTVVRLVSAHCPQLSIPAELAVVLEREAARVPTSTVPA